MPALSRELVLVVLLLAAVVAVTVGASMILPAAGWIVAGVLGGGWCVLAVRGFK